MSLQIKLDLLINLDMKLMLHIVKDTISQHEDSAISPQPVNRDSATSTNKATYNSDLVLNAVNGGLTATPCSRQVLEKESITSSMQSGKGNLPYLETCP